MKEEAVNTGNGTTASLDPSSLPVPLETPIKRQPSHLVDSRGRTSKKRALSATSLACLDSVDNLSIEVDQTCLSFRRLDRNYSVRDVNGDRVILRGVQDFNLFDSGGLKNVIVRDQENLPVARVCFKQKSCLYSSMALAVYAPYDALAGTGEETSGLFMFTSRLLLRNSDGDELFVIEYVNNVLSSYFKIKSTMDEGETVAKIVSKSRQRVGLQITSKMNMISKLILIGYCIALVRIAGVEMESHFSNT